jgi:ribonuclease HI
MLLRSDRVLARCDDDGALRSSEGRVEIVYRPGGKPYQAAVRNLEPAGGELVADDSFEVPAAAPSSRPKKKKGPVVSHAPLRAVGEEWLVYADGACRGNPGPAGLGVVIITRERVTELSEFLGDGTNNIAELTAILRAIERVDSPSRALRVFTESSYAIGLLSKGWKAKKNTALVEEIRARLRPLRDVSFIHVPGHAGVHWNEHADELAVSAIDARATTGWREGPPPPPA